MDAARLASLFLAVLASTVPSHAQEPPPELLAIYEFGKNNEGWLAMERMIHQPMVRERKAAEALLIGVLLRRDASPDARVLACRNLRLVGGKDSVPVLLSLLKSERLSSEARMSVERKHDPDIDRAMREALPSVPNRLKIGLLSSLAHRRDGQAVTATAVLAKGLPDVPVQVAAVRALGHLGNAAAWQALASLSFTEEASRRALDLALLDCASHLAEAQETRSAGLSALKKLADSDKPRPLRLAALHGLARADASQRASLAKHVLTHNDGEMLAALPNMLAILPAKESGDFYGAEFATFPTRSQHALLAHWRPEFGQIDALRRLASADNAAPETRQAALHALELAPTPALP